MIIRGIPGMERTGGTCCGLPIRPPVPSRCRIPSNPPVLWVPGYDTCAVLGQAAQTADATAPLLGRLAIRTTELSGDPRLDARLLATVTHQIGLPEGAKTPLLACTPWARFTERTDPLTSAVNRNSKTKMKQTPFVIATTLFGRRNGSVKNFTQNSGVVSFVRRQRRWL